MTRVAIYGASGYAGLELLKLLSRHPHVEVTTLITRQGESPTVDAVHPSLRGKFDLRLEQLDPGEVAERSDCVFTCLPHGASADVVRALLSVTENGERPFSVVDLSADYRLTDVDVYEKWYGVTHPDRDRLVSGVVYGLPEIYRDQIVAQAKEARQLIANPGCYPTSAILALAPLLKAGLVEADGIVVDSKSGVSGAGRSPKPTLHYPEANESFSAYGIGTHRHMPEIDQVLADASGNATEVLFTPHLVPMDRGILSTCYAKAKSGVSENDLNDELQRYYADEPFVHWTTALPTTKHVAGTNNCHLTARLVRGRAVIVSVIDNLIKGAAGAAVQNFNLMHGYDETTALL